MTFLRGTSALLERSGFTLYCSSPKAHRTLPVLYIYTRLDLCVASLAKALSSLSLVLLVWDVQYSHLLEPWECPPSVINTHCNQESEGILWLGRKVGVKCLKEVESATVVYVGRGEETLLGVVHTLPSNKVLHWEKNSLIPVGLAVTKLLMRRYFLVEKTKDASRIGLLVGTLGTEKYLDILEQLKTSGKNAGKRMYTFLVGKPNVAKLANFPEIDVFVLVACPETTLINSKEFLQPIITPFEFSLACNTSIQWSGRLVTDYRDLLGEQGQDLEQEEDSSEDGEGDVSLITGKARTTKLASDLRS